MLAATLDLRILSIRQCNGPVNGNNDNFKKKSATPSVSFVFATQKYKTEYCLCFNPCRHLRHRLQYQRGTGAFKKNHIVTISSLTDET